MGKNFEEVLKAINNTSETVQGLSGTAGALGATVGNFVNNYTAAKNGEATTARPINDIEVGLSKETSDTVKLLIVVIGLGLAAFIIPSLLGKRKEKNKNACKTMRIAQ